MDVATWLPSVIAVGALGVVWHQVRTNKTDVQKDVEKMADQIEKDSAEVLRKTEHDLLCENQALKMRVYFKEELTEFKDDIFGALRKLERTIRDDNAKQQNHSPQGD